MSTHFKERLNAYGLTIVRTYGDQAFMIADNSEQNRIEDGEISGYHKVLFLRVQDDRFSIELPVTGSPIDPLWVGSDSGTALDRLRFAFTIDDDVWPNHVRLRKALQVGT